MPNYICACMKTWNKLIVAIKIYKFYDNDCNRKAIGKKNTQLSADHRADKIPALLLTSTYIAYQEYILYSTLRAIVCGFPENSGQKIIKASPQRFIDKITTKNVEMNCDCYTTTLTHHPPHAHLRPSEKSKYTVELEMRTLLGVGESWVSSV